MSSSCMNISLSLLYRENIASKVGNIYKQLFDVYGVVLCCNFPFKWAQILPHILSGSVGKCILGQYCAIHMS